MHELSERPKGFRFPKTIISHAVYLSHRFLLSYRDVQELLFKRGVDVSRETVRVWCAKSGPDMAEALDTVGRDDAGVGIGTRYTWFSAELRISCDER